MRNVFLVAIVVATILVASAQADSPVDLSNLSDSTKVSFLQVVNYAENITPGTADVIFGRLLESPFYGVVPESIGVVIVNKHLKFIEIKDRMSIDYTKYMTLVVKSLVEKNNQSAVTTEDSASEEESPSPATNVSQAFIDSIKADAINERNQQIADSVTQVIEDSLEYVRLVEEITYSANLELLTNLLRYEPSDPKIIHEKSSPEKLARILLGEWNSAGNKVKAGEEEIMKSARADTFRSACNNLGIKGQSQERIISLFNPVNLDDSLRTLETKIDSLNKAFKKSKGFSDLVTTPKPPDSTDVKIHNSSLVNPPPKDPTTEQNLIDPPRDKKEKNAVLGFFFQDTLHIIGSVAVIIILVIVLIVIIVAIHRKRQCRIVPERPGRT
ncbi:MAG: hypothetical protein PHS07_02075 [Patescibacteria group bacterium]|nr:hypothetical protein [Patescibacteria group bacterium]